MCSAVYTSLSSWKGLESRLHEFVTYIYAFYVDSRQPLKYSVCSTKRKRWASPKTRGVDPDMESCSKGTVPKEFNGELIIWSKRPRQRGSYQKFIFLVEEKKCWIQSIEDVTMLHVACSISLSKKVKAMCKMVFVMYLRLFVT